MTNWIIAWRELPSFFRKSMLVFTFAVSACNLLPASAQTNITNFLTGLANKVTVDLQNALAVASVSNPNLPGGVTDQAGAACASTLIAVQKNVNAVITAAAAPGSGAVTAAEVASLFQPGSPQANLVRDQIVQGCGVKIAQVTGAVAGTAAWFAALAGMFAIPIPGA